MPRTAPALTPIRYADLLVAVHPAVAGCGARSRHARAFRKLDEAKHDDPGAVKFYGKLWALYAAVEDTPGDWDSFIAWVKQFLIDYGPLIIRILVSLLPLLLLGTKKRK